MLTHTCYPRYGTPPRSPPRRAHTQLTSAITFFLWKGATFRVPISTIQATKKKGEWDITDISTKCKALLYCRMYCQSIREDTTMAAWLQEWELIGPLPYPLYVAAYPCTPTYVRMYAMDMAYIPPPTTKKRQNSFANGPTSRFTQWQQRQLLRGACELKQYIQTTIGHRFALTYTKPGSLT